MKKVFQTLGLEKVQPGTFGIEIEAEGKGMEEVATKYWRTEDDGSLRGEYPHSRAEFVLKKPIERGLVKDAVKELIAALPDAKLDFSFRTSVHVHLNVQDLTHTQLLNVIYTYLLLEEPLMTYCGKERKGNRFCLRLADAEGVINILQGLFSDGPRSIRNFNGDQVRYSAINIAALQKYGSLEFRAMRGNMEVETIHTWTEALFKIKSFAMACKDPKEILKIFQEKDPKVFLKTVLQEVADPFIYPRMVKDMQRSLSLSLDLPYCFKEVAEEEVGKVDLKDPVRMQRQRALKNAGYPPMPDDIPYVAGVTGAHHDVGDYYRALGIPIPVKPNPLEEAIARAPQGRVVLNPDAEMPMPPAAPRPRRNPQQG
jgi:hypothetical protein